MPDTAPARTPVSARDLVLALVADVAVVLLFAAVGLASHNDGEVSSWGVTMVALPFLVGLAIAWLVTLAWRAPLAAVRTGLPVWAITLVLGLVGRFLLGEGIALPFVIVATLTLLVLLVGWRLLAGSLRRARERRAS
ncbi:DUF3054 domain-containing protein [Agrococcus sp. SL85]|uniref:DUF3054 domain-containing protein n=1 Tax=Agrococcus sp. SL85 TaxID=2995141 RepID=UPI00226CE67F|nr:DUF3054 domain-containing protein [Agrococcus sp. SL85]WAC67211.1 DUF3054 domain-containing protein [Agrococcus sp. SL85]